jgi:hypothetical protein
MPKIGVNTVEATSQALQSELARLEYLLSGFIDDENLLENNGSPVKITSKNVAGLPSSSKPVDNTMKLIGGIDFNVNIWWKIYGKFLKNKEYTFVQDSKAWAIDQKRINQADLMGLYYRNNKSENIGLFVKQFIFPKTLNMRLAKYSDLTDDPNTPFNSESIEALRKIGNADQYVFCPTISSESNVDSSLKFGINILGVIDREDDVVVDVELKASAKLDEDEFYAVNVGIEMLFEVLK